MAVPPTCMKGLVCDPFMMGPAGYVVRPESGGRYIVVLREPWHKIADAVNRDIRSSHPLTNRDHESVTITGDPEKETEEIQAIAHTLQVLSKDRLSTVHVLSDNWPLPDLQTWPTRPSA